MLAQAGTGTGKSLGYLAPTLVRLARGDLDRVVVTTATLALQSQLAEQGHPARPGCGRSRHRAAAAARDPQGPDQLRLPAEGARRCRRPGGADPGVRAGGLPAGVAAGRARVRPRGRGAGPARVGRGAAGRRGPGRPRRRPHAHRSRLAAGVHPGPGVPGHPALPAGRAVLRGEVAGGGAGGRSGGHQPRAARHRRHARRHGPPRAPGRGHRRSARADGPGDRSGLGRAESGDRRPGGPAGAGLAGRRRPGHRAADLGRHAPGRAGGDARWSGSRTPALP